MTPDPLMSSWIAEALAARGRRGSALTVAKEVWSRHEADLKASGDLLFTWQVDLLACAEAMVGAGALALDSSGEWVLPEGVTVSPPTRRTWTEDEIAVAVRGYVDMLKAEADGRPLRRTQVVAQIEADTTRTSEQVDAMLSNISAVVQEHGIEPLTAFRPRSNVPAGVRPAVAEALGL